MGSYTWNSSGSNANITTKLEGFPFVNSSATNARAVGSLGAVNGIAQGATLRLVMDPGHAGPYIIQQNSNNYTHNNTHTRTHHHRNCNTKYYNNHYHTHSERT